MADRPSIRSPIDQSMIRRGRTRGERGVIRPAGFLAFLLQRPIFC
jgi:hypothetical protein